MKRASREAPGASLHDSPCDGSDSAQASTVSARDIGPQRSAAPSPSGASVATNGGAESGGGRLPATLAPLGVGARVVARSSNDTPRPETRAPGPPPGPGKREGS